MDRVEVRPDSMLERGDIIAFEIPDAGLACSTGPGVWIKRVIGFPGETWAEKKGFIYIDGSRLREPYIGALWRDVNSIPKRKIPRASYVVLGDNRLASCDSRYWGYLSAKAVIGRVVAIQRGGEWKDVQ
jgi:signal peptidase I